MHFKARIYEQMQDEERAIQTWFEAANHSSTDKLARSRLIDLCRTTGRPLPPGMSKTGLPIEIKSDWEAWRSEHLDRGH